MQICMALAILTLSGAIIVPHVSSICCRSLLKNDCWAWAICAGIVLCYSCVQSMASPESHQYGPIVQEDPSAPKVPSRREVMIKEVVKEVVREVRVPERLPSVSIALQTIGQQPEVPEVAPATSVFAPEPFRPEPAAEPLGPEPAHDSRDDVTSCSCLPAPRMPSIAAPKLPSVGVQTPSLPSVSVPTPSLPSVSVPTPSLPSVPSPRAALPTVRTPSSRNLNEWEIITPGMPALPRIPRMPSFLSDSARAEEVTQVTFTTDPPDLPAPEPAPRAVPEMNFGAISARDPPPLPAPANPPPRYEPPPAKYEPPPAKHKPPPAKYEPPPARHEPPPVRYERPAPTLQPEPRQEEEPPRLLCGGRCAVIAGGAACCLILFIILIVLIRLHLLSRQSGEQRVVEVTATSLTPLQVARRECLQRTFRLFDSDGSGQISKDEVTAMLSHEGNSILLRLDDRKIVLARATAGEEMFFQNWTSHELDKIMGDFKADSDADGTLSFTEFFHWILQVEPTRYQDAGCHSNSEFHFEGESQWHVGAWSDCNVECGTGEQHRVAWCKTGEEKDCETSNSQPKPATVRPCSTYSRCAYAIGEWGECDSVCGPGHQWRDVWCSNGEEQACEKHMDRPAAKKGCNNIAGCRWTIHDWSPCSRECGTGTQTRLVECDNGDLESCEASMQTPAARQACSRYDGCSWETSDWGACSNNCGSGVKERSVRCATGSWTDCQHQSVAPAAKKPCSDISGCKWKMGSWTSCSNQCGRGLQHRALECSDGNVEDCKATFEQTPSTTRDCHEVAGCEWKTSAWSKCSAASDCSSGVGGACQGDGKVCGKGHQTREVTCINGEMADCLRLGNQPNKTRECHDVSGCLWAVGDWSDCSSQCGAGVEKRNVWCDNGADEDCLQRSPAPERTHQCSAYSGCRWSISDWSICSNLCGHGHQMRNVSCANGSPADCEQGPRPKPNQSQSCFSSVGCEWSKGSWSGCSNVCGQGMQFRLVHCSNGKNGYCAKHVDAPASQHECNDISGCHLLKDVPGTQHFLKQAPPCDCSILDPGVKASGVLDAVTGWLVGFSAVHELRRRSATSLLSPAALLLAGLGALATSLVLGASTSCEAKAHQSVLVGTYLTHCLAACILWCLSSCTLGVQPLCVPRIMWLIVGLGLLGMTGIVVSIALGESPDAVPFLSLGCAFGNCTHSLRGR